MYTDKNKIKKQYSDVNIQLNSAYVFLTCPITYIAKNMQLDKVWFSFSTEDMRCFLITLANE